MPQNEQEWMELSREFEALWNFTHSIGACDGKHIVIQCPQQIGSTFFNYKGTFSIVLMAVVNAKYCFTYFQCCTNQEESTYVSNCNRCHIGMLNIPLQ